MDAFVAVDQFGDMEIGGDAGEHIGVVAGEMFLGHEEIDHFADGERGAGVQVIVQAHGDVVGGGFGARPFQVQVFADDELEGADERSFEGGNVHFAVALSPAWPSPTSKSAPGVCTGM